MPGRGPLVPPPLPGSDSPIYRKTFMLVATNSPNGVGPYEWTEAGDAGALDLPYGVAMELLTFHSENYYSPEGVEAPKPEPAVEPVSPLEEDEIGSDNDIDEALAAAKVATTPKKRAPRKPATKE